MVMNGGGRGEAWDEQERINSGGRPDERGGCSGKDGPRKRGGRETIT